MVAGLSGDSGKTLVSLGLAAAWVRKGLRVIPFKKGPDYIDAAWLSLAAGVPCRNLDSFLMSGRTIRDTWRRHAPGADLALIEGNRGLFDGMDAAGTHSTAALARLLDVPVLLVVDVTKMTRTAAALVLGAVKLDPGLKFAGVILNRVGGSRHRNVAGEAIESVTGLPVLGAIPRVRGEKMIPGRHLGLLTTDEHPEAAEAVAEARRLVEEHLDLEALHARLREFPPPDAAGEAGPGGKEARPAGEPPRIGVLRDAAFPFYYPENLEALRGEGAELVTVSALADSGLPGELDALYIGGGFPETHAERLAANTGFLASLRRAAEAGLPIYAECGGLMLLTRRIAFRGRNYPMAGVLPVEVGWSDRPTGHGYTIGRVDRPNPVYPVGTEIRGHEFHHSHVEMLEGTLGEWTALELERGAGVGGGRDGLLAGNTLALYTHVHAAGQREWAAGLVAAAERHRRSRRDA